jgi:DNA polymerase-3 subunit delta'
MAFKAEKAMELLARAQERGRLGHAYLITGPKEADLEGFAVKVLNAISKVHHASLDLWDEHGAKVIRPESKSRRIRVEAIREQVEPFLFLTTSGQEHRFCVFVDAERMNEQAQNAFLRTLEEPPPRTLFLLLSEQPQQFLETILSRVIRIPLMPESGARKLSEAELKLVDLLSDMANRGMDSLAGAMTLRSEFEEILEEVHTRLTKRFEAEFDEEKKFYKQTTDVDSAWVKEREKGMEAAIEANYRQEREALMELLLAWIGDVLRHQAGVGRLDLPEHAEATRALAARWDGATLSRRLKELRKLQSHLQTNVNETLALDAAFMAAFA